MQGPNIVAALLSCCTRELPSYALDDRDGSVAGSLWKLCVLCRDHLGQWAGAVLAAVPETVATNPQKQEFMEALLSPAASRDTIEDAVRHFNRTCYQNSRRWRNT